MFSPKHRHLSTEQKFGLENVDEDKDDASGKASSRKHRRKSSLQDMQGFLKQFNNQQRRVSAALREVQKDAIEVDKYAEQMHRRVSLTQGVLSILKDKADRTEGRRKTFQEGTAKEKWHNLR